MRPQAQINAAMCALMREVRLLLSPAQSTAREHIAESRQERAKAALRQWRKAGRMPPFSGDRKGVVSGRSVSVRLDLGGRRYIKKKKNNIRNGMITKNN